MPAGPEVRLRACSCWLAGSWVRSPAHRRSMFRGTVVKVDGNVEVGERADTVGLGVSTWRRTKNLKGACCGVW